MGHGGGVVLFPDPWQDEKGREGRKGLVNNGPKISIF